jgi:hypothetical protein
MALGPEAEGAESQTAHACLGAAARLLETLIAGGRFGRDSALDLLTVDALTTLAFEHAGVSASEEELAALAQQGVSVLGQIPSHRV